MRAREIFSESFGSIYKEQFIRLIRRDNFLRFFFPQADNFLKFRGVFVDLAQSNFCGGAGALFIEQHFLFSEQLNTLPKPVAGPTKKKICYLGSLQDKIEFFLSRGESWRFVISNIKDGLCQQRKCVSLESYLSLKNSEFEFVL